MGNKTVNSAQHQTIADMTFKHAGFYFIFLLVLSIIGFWDSYFSKILDEDNRYVHFHAITMLLWLILLITQSILIKNNRQKLHKLIGKFSYVLVPLIIISLLLLAHDQITIHEYGISYSRLYILFLQISLLVIFVIAYVFAIVFRYSPAHHARFMISTALTFIDPIVARIPLNIPPLPFNYQVLTFGLTDFIVLLLIFIERHQSRGRGVFPAMLIIFIIFQCLNLTFTRHVIWDNFSLWFATLPLT
ncbi:hypothetical protein MNBD_GAMMA13-1950 [hydrothermal vent metagenome]|uniref:Uncharacterized protein n=1 Tax=hydrothermal vent metagenome TaxID=652676 RepID=A0A3B0YF61_9ZZZZ